MKKVRKAVIPAAGYGTRFLPVTKSSAKEMLPIIDTPTIDYIVREALDSGIEEILIIVSSNKNSIVDYFDRNFELESQLKEKNKLAELAIITELPKRVNIHFIRQQEQLGLGHAVLCAKSFVGNEPFALMLGDDLYVGKDKPVIKQLIDAYDVTSSSIIGTLKVEDSEVDKYGIVSPLSLSSERLLEINGVTEKPNLSEAPSNLAAGGRYVLTPGIFKYLETQTRGKGNEIQLTDSLLRLLETEKVYSYEVNGDRYDIGSKIGFITATIDFALKRDDLHDSVMDLLKRKVK